MTDLKEQVLAYVAGHPGTSFAELTRELEDTGDYLLDLGHNIVIWEGISYELVSAITSLRQEKRIKLEPCAPLIYLIDGTLLRHPVITGKPPAQGYKNPRWLPVVINLEGKK